MVNISGEEDAYHCDTAAFADVFSTGMIVVAVYEASVAVWANHLWR
jgi:hypothetical protein